MNKKAPLLILLAVIIAVGAWYYFSQIPEAEAPADTLPPEEEQAPALPPGGMETGEIDFPLSSSTPREEGSN